MLLAYFGPETVLPVTSVVAALAGFLMMAGRQTWSLTTRSARKVGEGLGLTWRPESGAMGRSAGRKPAARIASDPVGAERN